MGKLPEALAPQTSKEGQMEIILSTPLQKEALFHALFGYLMAHTSQEAMGRLSSQELINFNNALRPMVKQLAIDLGKDKKMDPIDWLFLGIPEFIPNEELEKWANPSKPPNWTEENILFIARYLLKQKKQSNPQE